MAQKPSPALPPGAWRKCPGRQYCFDSIFTTSCWRRQTQKVQDRILHVLGRAALPRRPRIQGRAAALPYRDGEELLSCAQTQMRLAFSCTVKASRTGMVVSRKAHGAAVCDRRHCATTHSGGLRPGGKYHLLSFGFAVRDSFHEHRISKVSAINNLSSGNRGGRPERASRNALRRNGLKMPPPLRMFPDFDLPRAIVWRSVGPAAGSFWSKCGFPNSARPKSKNHGGKIIRTIMELSSRMQ